MASPQTEDGYLRISLELLEQLYASPLSGAEFRVALFIMRKTWGWQKKEDFISISQVQKAAGLSRKGAVENLNKLVTKRLLVVTKRKLPNAINTYQFNKNYDEWLVTKKTLGSYQTVTRVVTKRKLGVEREVVTKRKPTIDTKETKQKIIYDIDWLRNADEADMQSIADVKKVDIRDVKSYMAKAIGWYDEKPNDKARKGRNWRATVMNWLQRDLDNGKIQRKVVYKEPEAMPEISEEERQASLARIAEAKEKLFNRQG